MTTINSIRFLFPFHVFNRKTLNRSHSHYSCIEKFIARRILAFCFYRKHDNKNAVVKNILVNEKVIIIKEYNKLPNKFTNRL